MDAAIAQFPVVQIGFLSPFARQFGDAGNGLALLLRLLHLLQHDLCNVGVLMQEIVYFRFNEIAHELV